ncbi:pentatricopeptide repeat-containing protein [Quercus suber]|uniref:Pentatricopeptide repeat-containing protein n=1 Tax=Quercus suber TaxID=58331 RepID=A0AAW0I517_QUESU
MEDAHKAFDMHFEKNLISYNTIDIGIGASVFTFASLLSGAASIGAVSKGEQIHAWVLKSGSSSNKIICNALTPCILGYPPRPHHLLPLPRVLYKVPELPTQQTRSHPLLDSLPTLSFSIL